MSIINNLLKLRQIRLSCPSSQVGKKYIYFTKLRLHLLILEVDLLHTHPWILKISIKYLDFEFLHFSSFGNSFRYRSQEIFSTIYLVQFSLFFMKFMSNGNYKSLLALGDFIYKQALVALFCNRVFINNAFKNFL